MNIGSGNHKSNLSKKELQNKERLAKIEAYVNANINDPYMTLSSVCLAVGIHPLFPHTARQNEQLRGRMIAILDQIKRQRSRSREVAKAILSGLIKNSHLTQQEISKTTGLSHGGISSFAVQRTFPNKENLGMILDVLGVSRSDFLEMCIAQKCSVLEARAKEVKKAKPQKTNAKKVNPKKVKTQKTRPQVWASFTQGPSTFVGDGSSVQLGHRLQAEAIARRYGPNVKVKSMFVR